VNDRSTAAMPDSNTLMEIVRAQTEIAKLGLDLGGVMSFVTERVRHITHGNGAVVELAEGDEMVYRAASGSVEPLLGLRLKQMGSLSGMCVRTGGVLRCDDSENDERVDREACRRVGLRSMLVTPLKHLDTTVGVLKVVSPEVNAFCDADVHSLGLMSELIAAAMFHAAKYETSQLYLQATHDALTGLPNRALFFDRLRQSIHQVVRGSGTLGVINLDMDALKPINDQFGHRAGDAAICEAAQRMSHSIRRADTVARVGGDEFAMILHGISSRNDAEVHRKRVVENMEQPFEFEGHPISLGVSIGIAILPEDGTEMQALLERADQAMYANKRDRKNGNGDPGKR
jgi:diguanylate cyclase (GGDEF)-like protein